MLPVSCPVKVCAFSFATFAIPRNSERSRKIFVIFRNWFGYFAVWANYLFF
tara:strand:+ start:654 stop:806 length:153 start_codon:yes stop_codon:yes gene_type:complete